MSEKGHGARILTQLLVAIEQVGEVGLEAVHLEVHVQAGHVVERKAALGVETRLRVHGHRHVLRVQEHLPLAVQGDEQDAAEQAVVRLELHLGQREGGLPAVVLLEHPAKWMMHCLGTRNSEPSFHSLALQDVRVPEPNDLDVGQLHLEVDRVAVALGDPDAVEIEGVEALDAGEPGNAWESEPDGQQRTPTLSPPRIPTIVQLVEQLLNAVGRAVHKVLVGYPTLFDVICCGSIRSLFSSVRFNSYQCRSVSSASASKANQIHTENSEKQIRFSGAIFLAQFEQRVSAAKRVSHKCVLAKTEDC